MLGVLVGLVATVALSHELVSGDEQTSEARGNDDGRLGDIESRLDAIERRGQAEAWGRDGHARPLHFEVQNEHADDQAEEPAPHEIMTEEEARAEDDRRSQDLREYVAAEVADANWARQVDDSVRQYTEDQQLQGVGIPLIECGSTVCRMELTSADRFSPMDIVARLDESQLVGEAFMRASDEPNGYRSVQIFFARNGERLPIGY